jgi:hypothetical protein
MMRYIGVWYPTFGNRRLPPRNIRAIFVKVYEEPVGGPLGFLETGRDACLGLRDGFLIKLQLSLGEVIEELRAGQDGVGF